jgi:hypothetical protein
MTALSSLQSTRLLNMPQAPVDNILEGTELFYTDSGPVPGSTDYTTLVIYHGNACTGREFHRFIDIDTS